MFSKIFTNRLLLINTRVLRHLTIKPDPSRPTKKRLNVELNEYIHVSRLPSRPRRPDSVGVSEETVDQNRGHLFRTEEVYLLLSGRCVLSFWSIRLQTVLKRKKLTQVEGNRFRSVYLSYTTVSSPGVPTPTSLPTGTSLW